MATFAIGDVHGNYRALADLVSQIERVASPEDTIVFLGDYIDRGRQSKDCIERILSLSKSSAARVIALMGNHEEWLLQTADDYSRHSWVFMGAFPTIESYSRAAAAAIHDEIMRLGPRLILEKVRLPYEGFFQAMPAEHLRFFRDLKTFHRTPDAVCAHAGLDPAMGPVEVRETRSLIWGAEDFPEAYRGEDYMLYGHADNPYIDRDGWPHPRIQGRTYGLDTISRGVLTAVRLPGGTVYQSARYI
jgi:calcineurin-like phosphoesterase family protein